MPKKPVHNLDISATIALGNTADALWYEIVDFEAAVDDDAIAKHFATFTETQFQVLAKIQQEWQGA
ncbi:hypothetical protein [Weissella confusa]|uniref:hypothetical protein n=1 Tax=Weissella confusa TaxID=1583 RepID=UPI0018F21B4A|nr:hypothetical protein [Weissella confusa]